MDRTELISQIAEKSKLDFERVAIQVFHYQYQHNAIYRSWVDNLQVVPSEVTTLNYIPFLPISAFKSHKLHCELKEEMVIFTSSGTSGSTPSSHYVFDLDLYLQNAQRIFESFYGPVKEYCFLALLPSYLERSGSSLIAMVDHFIQQSEYKESGFYLYNHDELKSTLEHCKRQSIPTVLFGVSFALLDFIEEHALSFPELLIIETGGMKGRKKEITRQQLHDQISNGFGVDQVHSEYGMTELFSQAYSKGDGVFYVGSTMHVVVKEITDPLTIAKNGATGIVNVIDLANIDSCAFIETQDLGRSYADGSFEILGRMDVSEIRGCNLMVGEDAL
ncbi:MAG: acyl transferase [Saprospiraceae bacterium]|nr:acyl transferase [Saprospiraceae bacterium]